MRDRGATLVEYILLLAVIAVVCTVGLKFLGSASSSTFGKPFAGTTTTTLPAHCTNGHGNDGNTPACNG